MDALYFTDGGLSSLTLGWTRDAHDVWENIVDGLFVSGM